MTGQQTGRADAPPRQLRRRGAGRVLGGVAGGLGDYFNIDPLLIRIGFVGLMIFGGAGLVLYVIAWLLLPAEGWTASIVERFLRLFGLTPWRIVWILAIVWGAVLVLSRPVGGPWGGGWLIPYGDGSVLLAAAVIIGGILLWRGRSGPAPAAPVTATPALTVSAPVARVPAVPRPRSPLAWYVYAAILLTVGLLAIVSQLAEQEVTPGQFFGAALGVLGIGLVVGAWWGRARILILVALLLLPIAIFASFMTAPLEGGVGDRNYAPVTVAELQDQYRSMSGRLSLDLTNLGTDARTFHIAASVAVGQLVVTLPEGASVELRARVGAGDTLVLGNFDAGTSLDRVFVRRHLNRTTYLLDLQAGIGEVYVHYAGSN